jgi:hypothetical protein
MITRILGTGIGILLILLVLLARGIPVLFFINLMLPFVLIIVGAAFIYAGLTSD